MNLLPPRWANGPAICPCANLPRFETEAEANGFIRALYPITGSSHYAVVRCPEVGRRFDPGQCGGFHVLTGLQHESHHPEPPRKKTLSQMLELFETNL